MTRHGPPVTTTVRLASRAVHHRPNTHTIRDVIVPHTLRVHAPRCRSLVNFTHVSQPCSACKSCGPSTALGGTDLSPSILPEVLFRVFRLQLGVLEMPKHHRVHDVSTRGRLHDVASLSLLHAIQQRVRVWDFVNAGTT